ncbi:MAG: hypothetical protein JOZ27_08865, partial [Caulobacteraceae bacterium]|nr:hypothetical protein [Caulobacteraceae bacterium]
MTAIVWRFSALVLALSPALAIAADSTSIPAPQMREGDAWVFDRTNERGTSGFSQGRQAMRIERVESDTMVLGVKPEGAPTDFQDQVLGLDWSKRRLIMGKEVVTARPFAFPLSVGKTWTADYEDPTQHGAQVRAFFRVAYKAVGWEDVTTPAGTFHALKIEATTNVEAHMAAQNIAAGGAASTLNSAGASSQVTHLPERDV